MGVFGTFCQICGLPVQHTCYVSIDGGPEGVMRIYRGDPQDEEPEAPPPVPFLLEHAWLCEAVALSPDPTRPPVPGTVQDGDLKPNNPEDIPAPPPTEIPPELAAMPGFDPEAFHQLQASMAASRTLFVATGDADDSDDGLITVHSACLDLATEHRARRGLPPPSVEDIERVSASDAWRPFSNTYHQQLFDFDRLRSDDLAWALVDPRMVQDGEADTSSGSDDAAGEGNGPHRADDSSGANTGLEGGSAGGSSADVNASGGTVEAAAKRSRLRVLALLSALDAGNTAE
uniref:Uncharacterized protein n=1 Tax=Chromera velia CCMP2878 TaxID=1169474 RepID=A0A0G4F5I4_9ALVE|eukprot:Cvel_2780.t1-p1 / transcript=Cvel_2780.t1 / gene=Cvel_2780 / organism=Chromera_velia_CCMP2878 / gene_product=hypothetical protein / transcript_product=hypothetical protein / location=Cvel_scaffold111:134367-135227(+) / protein_length=287 / sequence_SO=supercontig / SO=protein_coding / is_pseudo=false